MYSVGHKNIFIAVVVTSFGHNSHHQANAIQSLERLVTRSAKIVNCVGSHLPLCYNLLTT